MHTAPTTPPLIILGAGYTGRFLATALSLQGRTAFFTSRDPDHRLSHVPPPQRVRFDLTRPATWANIPPSADLIWCFPAVPLDLVQQFSDTVTPIGRLVVLGSTSAYEIDGATTYPPLWIDETAPIDLSQPRVQGEEFLRKTHGGVLLRVAGIYGPERNPLDWIRRGRVGSSRKFVNLIHAEDLASICLAALERGMPGEAYNVSDGTPRRWEDIVSHATERWGVIPTGTDPRPEPGKRIDTRKLHDRFGAMVCHGDLFAELDAMERG